ncbi:hypothetical protein DKX38_011942 [Salix brachista]|uniref:Sulfotransferase n=1 Tax=Salix brachista TaxID=2182728 RepID=A0A5N5M2Y2_9ROSI|nr:hypothetical protein DKX38_011942 [Salix brachista]
MAVQLHHFFSHIRDYKFKDFPSFPFTTAHSESKPTNYTEVSSTSSCLSPKCLKYTSQLHGGGFESSISRVRASRRDERVLSDDGKKKRREEFSDSDDDDDDDYSSRKGKVNDPYLMDAEERREWRMKIREVMKKYPDVDENAELDSEEKKMKMEKLLSDYPLIVDEDDPDWPEDADGRGFGLDQFFNKITIKNKKKDDDDENYDSDKEIVWQDDDSIRPIKDITTAGWEEAVFKDISPLIVLVHNRYKRSDALDFPVASKVPGLGNALGSRLYCWLFWEGNARNDKLCWEGNGLNYLPKENEKIRDALEKAVHIIWNCRLPSPRCVAIDAVVETELVSALKVSVFPEIIFTKAGKILYREKAFRTADEFSKIMAYFYYGAGRPPCLNDIGDSQELIPSVHSRSATVTAISLRDITRCEHRKSRRLCDSGSEGQRAGSCLPPGKVKPASNLSMSSTDKSVGIVGLLDANYTWCAAAAAIDSILKNLEEGARASSESPDRILFLKYEDLKKETLFHAGKLANFMGLEEFLLLQGVVQNIIHLCSFENLSNLGVKATGMYHKAISLILQCKGSRSSG